MRVVVVGAGVSGLTCARELRQAGVAVTVVEARDRVGGRIWTGEVAGFAVDLGGAWIHGPRDNPLAEYCRQVGLGWASDGAWGSRMQVHTEDGSLLSHTATTSVVTAWSDFDPAEAVAALGAEVSFADAIEWYIADRTLVGEPADAVRFSLSWLEAGLNIGSHPNSISATGAAEYQLHAGGNVILTGGYRALIDHLAEDLEISLEEPVLAVEHGPGGVVVSTSHRSIRADHVVVTVPIGVLKRRLIVFDPPLPPRIERSIANLELSTVEKVVVRYRERWWPDDIRRLVHVTDAHRFPAWMDLSAHVAAPTLVGLFNPAVAPMPDDQGSRFEIAIEAITTMLGTGPKPIGAMITDWRNDPYATGAYSYIPAGAEAADMRSFGHLEGALMFAGEHTVAEYHGTVHAAFVSGRRAAQRLIGS